MFINMMFMMHLIAEYVAMFGVDNVSNMVKYGVFK